MKHQELAMDEWWKSLTKQQQKHYIEEHPNSKYAKKVKSGGAKLAPTGTATMKKGGRLTWVPDKAKKSTPKPKTDARDLLKKDGSPTNFKGPKSAKDAMSNDPKAERKTVALLDKLAKMAADAKAKGEDAPNYNLCEVSIPGTNLFCSGNKDIPRKEMPQLKGNPVPGSWAAKQLKADAKGEVDSEAAFKAHLKKQNIALDNKSVDVATLKATQSELVGAKVAGMLQALKENPHHAGITAPIFVSKDGYILDGHHRWAAMVGLALADGRPNPVMMDVIEVDMDIEDLVKQTNDFANEIGIAQKAATTKKESASAKYSSGDTVYMYWLATDKWVPVNYRGPLGSDSAVVVKDGMQFTVKLADLKDKPQLSRAYKGCCG